MGPDDLERAAEILRRAGLSTTTGPGADLLWEYDSAIDSAIIPAPAGTTLRSLLRDATEEVGRAIRQQTDADALAQEVGALCGRLKASGAPSSVGAAWTPIEEELRRLHRALQEKSPDRRDVQEALPLDYRVAIASAGRALDDNTAPTGSPTRLEQYLISAHSAVSPDVRVVPSAAVCSAPEDVPRLRWLLQRIDTLGGCGRAEVPEVAAALLAASRRERGDWADLLARVQREWSAVAAPPRRPA
jgi:hypothetical protein